MKGTFVFNSCINHIDHPLSLPCGCSNANAPASGAVNDPAGSTDGSLQTAAVSAQQPANVQTPAAEPAAAGSASGEIVQTAAKKKKTTVTNPEAPWEDFNMRGIPEVLDRLKKDDGDLFVLVNKLHAVSKNYKPTDMVVMDNKLTTWQNLEMKSDAYDAYLKLYRAAKKKAFLSRSALPTAPTAHKRLCMPTRSRLRDARQPTSVPRAPDAASTIPATRSTSPPSPWAGG